MAEPTRHNEIAYRVLIIITAAPFSMKSLLCLNQNRTSANATETPKHMAAKQQAVLVSLLTLLLASKDL